MRKREFRNLNLKKTNFLFLGNFENEILKFKNLKINGPLEFKFKTIVKKYNLH